jgi:hypothetical protein
VATRFCIPVEVVHGIQKWTRRAELEAIADFPQTFADEDAIVESFGIRLRCRTRVVEVAGQQELPGPWKWSISHTRLRGRGRGAAEKHVGADVIVELAVRRPNRYQVDAKTLLIQAKENWTNDSKIIEQAARLSTWQEAAAFTNLTAKRFEAFRIDDVIAARGQRPSHVAIRLSDFFANDFVSGELGDETLLYDARRRLLQWLDMKDIHVRCSFHCRHRLLITITPPAPLGPWTNPALIEPEEIHEHRLKATSAQILGVPYSPNTFELQAARRRLQKIYHTDKHADAADFVEQAMKRRSQEINYAFAALHRDR